MIPYQGTSSTKEALRGNQPACSTCSHWKMGSHWITGFPLSTALWRWALPPLFKPYLLTSFGFLPEFFPLPSDINHGMLGSGEQSPDGLVLVDPSRPSSTIPLPSPEQAIQDELLSFSIVLIISYDTSARKLF